MQVSNNPTYLKINGASPNFVLQFWSKHTIEIFCVTAVKLKMFIKPQFFTKVNKQKISYLMHNINQYKVYLTCALINK